jgi:hypothetical protein
MQIVLPDAGFAPAVWRRSAVRARNGLAIISGISAARAKDAKVTDYAEKELVPSPLNSTQHGA